MNQFKYSLDNKRYHTYNYYLKNKYHQKVAKVALNADFTCPNRDGTKGYGGCIFCSSSGSGDYAGNVHDHLEKQFQTISQVMKRKWPECAYIAYFQANTNTYGPLDKIKKIETEMKNLSQDMENINTINKYREIYKYHKKNPEDKQFAEEYYSELSVYKIAAKEILERYKKLPNTKEILYKLDELQEKKNTLMQEYSLNKEQFSDLVQYRKNYENYYGKEVER